MNQAASLALILASLAPSCAAQRALVMTPIESLPAPEKRWALLIGVDDYDDKNISHLLGAGNDARALKDALVRYAGFPKEQIVLLATGEAQTHQPTRAAVFQSLSNILRAMPKEGLFLFAFSGHGMERGGHAFLLPQDARLNDDPEVLQDLSVSIDRVKERIQLAGVAQILLLLDACRGSIGGRSTVANVLTPAFTEGFHLDETNRGVRAFAMIYATEEGQRAWEIAEKKRGYFSWALEEGLSGKAANGRGEVTLGGLISYIEERVPREIALDLGNDKDQRPFARIEGYRAHDLVLARIPKTNDFANQMVAKEAWEQIRTTRNRDVLKAFAIVFHGTEYAKLADAQSEMAGQLRSDLDPESKVGRARRMLSDLGLAQFVQVLDGKEIDLEKDLDMRTLKNDANVQNAFSLLRSAAESGNAAAMIVAAFWYFAEGDQTAGVQYLRSAADLGDTRAMLFLGLAFLELDGGDNEKAVDWVTKAGEQGNIQAMNVLGAFYIQGVVVEQDYQTAMDWFLDSAKLGDATAMSALGDFYVDGIVVKQDFSEAMNWYQKAVSKGNSQAMLHIGYLFSRGFKGPPNLDEAIRWYLKAAEAGSFRAMYELGTLYLDGKGFQKDEVEGLRWIRKAAEAGVKESMEKMAELCELRNSPRDFDEALVWLRKVADSPDAKVIDQIGSFYEFGRLEEHKAGGLLNRDLSEAETWYRRAVEAGYTDAVQDLDRLGKKRQEVKVSIGANFHDGASYALVPHGTFAMGCSALDDYCSDEDEMPNHRVAITADFWIARADVTVHAFERVMGFLPGSAPDATPSKHLKAIDNLSLIRNVTWKDANQYCMSVGMRLPTEAEWEYAMRYFNGFAPSLFETATDTNDWTQDWYDANYYKNSPEKDPKGPQNGEQRVLRGPLPSFRSFLKPTTSSPYSSFRCASSLIGGAVTPK